MALLIFTLTLVLMAEFVNGWTDAPNAIATVVATRVLSVPKAIVLAVILNTAGAMTGTAVAATVGKGIVDPHLITLPALCAAMCSVIAWGCFAAHNGFPVSKSHALLSGLAGAGLASGGVDALEWTGWKLVFIGMAGSVLLGIFAAFVIGTLITKCAGNLPSGKAKRAFDLLQILSASFMAFAHGMNDGQKFMGVFTLALLLGDAIPIFQVPSWVVLVCAGTMGVGTSLGGYRIIRTIGMRMAHIESWQGFAAETSAAATITCASMCGIPLSTTHTITSSIAGAASSRRVGSVQWFVLRDIVLAWIITFPVCTGVSYGVAFLCGEFF